MDHLLYVLLVIINLILIPFEQFYSGVIDFYYCLIMGYIIKQIISRTMDIVITNEHFQLE